MAPQHLPIAEAASVVAGVVVPFLTALIVKSRASDQLKALVAFLLSAVAGAITTTVFVDGERWQDYVIAIGVVFVTNVATHYSGATGKIAQLTALVGIGNDGLDKAA
jgi:hypothetical protein